MNQTKMIEEVKKHGLNMSIPLLYRTGMRFGFLTKNENATKEKYIVDETKFSQWLDDMTNPSNDEWISIPDVCSQYDMEYATVKYYVKKNNLETRKMGFIRGGIVHVRKSDIGSIVAKCNSRSNREK